MSDLISPAPTRQGAGRHAAEVGENPAGVRALLELAPRRRVNVAYAPRPRIPDYVGFCVVAERHAAVWEVTYAHGVPAAYQARHRVMGYLITASDLQVFDHLLGVFEAPAYARPYIDCVRCVQVPR